MPGQIRSVLGLGTIYSYFQATLFNEDKTTLWTRNWPNGLRGSSTRESDWTHQGGRWPSSSGFYSDPAAPANLIASQDMLGCANTDYGPWELVDTGTSSLKFIMGRCVDSDDAGVSGAIVQGFLTASDLFVRETTADSNGYYELGTQYASPTTHYIVSYRAGAPDIAGTSVNTLTATNRDGTT